MVKCIDSPLNGEFTLCGDAWDAYETGDVEEPIVFAEEGEKITCPECMKVIKFCKTVRYGRAPRSE